MNILLIDRFPEDMLSKLRALGHPLTYAPEWDRAQVLAAMPETDILIMNSKVNADRELLDAAPRLRFLGRAGVGMDHFDLPLLAERGVRVVNTPGANALPVGEQTVGMLLSMMHRIVRADAEVRRLKWSREPNRGTELTGKTVGIIGYGATGSATARCLRGFDVRILAYDKYRKGFGADPAHAHVEEAPLERLMEEAEILSLHIPLTEETRGWVDARFLSRFRHPLWFLNLARGPIVPLSGLMEALQAGHVRAAALDVLENERLDRLSAAEQARLQALIDDGRVIFTPHIGGWSHESLQRINDRLVEAVAQFLQEIEG